MATPASSIPDITLPPATECEAYLRTVRAELCRLTGETYASVAILLEGDGAKLTWSTYTDATTHFHTKSPHAGLGLQYYAKESGVYPRLTPPPKPSSSLRSLNSQLQTSANYSMPCPPPVNPTPATSSALIAPAS